MSSGIWPVSLFPYRSMDFRFFKSPTADEISPLEVQIWQDQRNNWQADIVPIIRCLENSRILSMISSKVTLAFLSSTIASKVLPTFFYYIQKLVVDCNCNQNHQLEQKDFHGFAATVESAVGHSNHSHLLGLYTDLAGQLSGPNQRHSVEDGRVKCSCSAWCSQLLLMMDY